MFREGQPSEAQQTSIEALETLRQVLPEKHPEIGSGTFSLLWMKHTSSDARVSCFRACSTGKLLQSDESVS